MRFTAIRSAIGRMVIYRLVGKLMRTPPDPHATSHLIQRTSSRIDLIAVAFNSLEIIKLQASLLRQNLKDDHSYIVVDNSSKTEESDVIADFCATNGIGYLRVPENPSGSAALVYPTAPP
jgi:hypothetical protein